MHDNPGGTRSCVGGIDFASFYDFYICFWNCFDSVVFFIFHFIKLVLPYFFFRER
jgi:hypothetical protein